MEVWGFIPHIRQGICYWSPTGKKRLKTGLIEGEIGKPNDHFCAYSKSAFQRPIYMLYLLKSLIQYSVIERPRFIIREATLDIVMKNI